MNTNGGYTLWMHILFDSVILFFLYDNKKDADVTKLVKTEYVEASHSERIFLTTSCTDYIILCLLKDDIKAVANSSLGEIDDVEVVLQVDIEYDETVASGWYYGLLVSNFSLVNGGFQILEVDLWTRTPILVYIGTFDIP